jgi:hypothetical protein
MGDSLKELEGRVDTLETRTNKLELKYEAHTAASGEQIKTLFASVQRLFWVSVIFGGILLLTVVYGAIGEHGFNHVTQATHDIITTTK